MMKGVEFRPQVGRIEQDRVRYGEEIRIGPGNTGYVEWNGGFYSVKNLNTARMFLVKSGVYDIYVEPGGRDKDIGRKLLWSLVKRVRERRYDQLVILQATWDARGFYTKILEEMLEQKAIRSLSEELREDEEGADFCYRIWL